MSKSIKTNVFISWSGETSLKHAEILKELIEGCFSHAKVFISTEMDRGSKWLNQISSELDGAKVGIVCLTKLNKEKPWIMYESGALAAGFSKDRVCTVLIGGLQNTDVKEPLAQYNHTSISSKVQVRSLLDTINKASATDLIQEKHKLDRSFDVWWKDLEERFNTIQEEQEPADSKASNPSRSTEDMVREILTGVRSLQKQSDSDRLLAAVPETKLRDGLYDWFPNFMASPNDSALAKELGEKLHDATSDDLKMAELFVYNSLYNNAHEQLKKYGISKRDLFLIVAYNLLDTNH